MRAGAPLLAAAFALGLIAGDRWPGVASAALGAALLACVASLGLRARTSRRALAALVAALAAGAALMGSRVASARASLAQPRREAVIEARVARVERFTGATRLELEHTAWVLPASAGPAHVRASLPPGAPPPPAGARIRAAIRTRPLRPGVANPGAADPTLALARAGIGRVADVPSPALVEIVEEPSGNPLISIANRRSEASAVLRRTGRGGALLAALALGDQDGLPERDRRAWAALGIAHLLSVSGLHLALAAGAAYAGASRILRRSARLCERCDTRRAALAFGVLAASGYALLAGGATPALRSLAMLGGVALAISLRRAGSATHGLALAALLVLAFDPSALFAAGAQLSFAATAALVIGRATEAERSGGALRRWLALALSTTARATLATAPIAALHFGAAPPLAGVANVVAVPITGALLMPAAFVAAAHALSSPGGAPPDALLSSAAWLAARALDAALALAQLAPRFIPAPPSPLALAACAPLLALGLRTRRLWLRLACTVATQAALALLTPPAIEPAPPRMVFIDVGHGDALLVQSRELVLLIDAGAASPDGWDAGARIVVPALAALGVRRLDALAITHADLDHRGGAPAVLDTFPCRELWLPRGAVRDPSFRALVAHARALGVRVRELGAGDAPLMRGALRVAPLWPPAEARGLGDNDRSLVLRVELPGLRALLLGDLEARGELSLLASGAELRADVVKLAHHGSRSSSTSALLHAVSPRLAIASAPLHGRFGWPHREVRERLAERRIPLAWTGRDGALLVAAPREACLRRWRFDARCAPPSSPARSVRPARAANPHEPFVEEGP